MLMMWRPDGAGAAAEHLLVVLCLLSLHQPSCAEALLVAAYLLAVVLSPLRLAMLSVAVLLQAAVRELQHCLTAQVAQ
jgi:hypothetical protein